MWGHMRNHSHNCRFKEYGCNNLVKCSDAFLYRNHDGYPEVVCALNPEDRIECDACEESEKCDYCGMPIDCIPHLEDCEYWYQTPVPVHLVGENIPIEFYYDEEVDVFDDRRQEWGCINAF